MDVQVGDEPHGKDYNTDPASGKPKRPFPVMVRVMAEQTAIPARGERRSRDRASIPYCRCPSATSTTPTRMISIAITLVPSIRSPRSQAPSRTAITGFT